MAVTLKSTREVARLNGVKIVVYGDAGAGKTTLAATTGGNPLIISAEGGMLSLRDHDFAVAEVSTIDDVRQAFAFARDEESFDWIILDSISEIAEVVLNAEKKATADPRRAYGALAEQMTDLIRAFRDIPRNVVFTAKAERVKDEATGRMYWAPSMPGAKLGQALPYFVDEVLCLRVEPDDDGTPTRWLQTQPDSTRIAKDRSGALDMFEPPNLAAIAAKILSTPRHLAAAA